MTTPTTPIRAARRLNAHHMRTCAGFYGFCNEKRMGERYFMARARKGVLQVSPDFGETWRNADLAVDRFHDHNGREINL